MALTPEKSGTTYTKNQAVTQLLERLEPSDLQLLTSRDTFKHYSFSAHERNVLFVNCGGQRFLEAGYPLGVDVDLESRGVAVGDLNRDGQLDLVVRSIARKKLTYLENQVQQQPEQPASHFLRVVLHGTASNRDAVGATVRLVAGGLRQMRVKMAGSGFQGQSEGTLHFGLGAADRVDELVIRWPSGTEQRFTDLPADLEIAVIEGQRGWQIEPLPARLPQRSETPVAAAPAWHARTLDGGSWRPTPGRPALVSLWASWCLPCQKEVPGLNELQTRLGAVVDVVGISIEDDLPAVRAFAEHTAPRYPLATARGAHLEPLLELAWSDGVVALPATVLLDHQGRVRRVLSGASVAVLERELRRLTASGSG